MQPNFIARFLWGLLVLDISTALLDISAARAADWLQFRGNDSRSFSPQTTLPADADLSKVVAWKRPIPGRAVSGPIVVGGRVIATSSAGPHDDHLYVVCFDAKSGDRVWQREFQATGRTLHHPASAVAAPTPASDGQLIFAFFSSNDLFCFDLDGNLKWLRGLTVDYPHSYNDTGMAASPCVVGDTVVVQMECQGDSFAIGINKQTGETRWRTDRARSANWTSPIAIHTQRGDQILLQSSDRLSAHQPDTGELMWSYDTSCSTIPSATSNGDLILVPSGGLTALRPPSDPKQKAPEVVWKQNRLAADNASPILAGDRVYVINGGNVLVAGNTADGKIESQLRLSGTFWATPTIAGDYLYAINQDGLLLVVHLPQGKEKAVIVARHELKEPVYGTAAIGDGALFIRGESSLWKLADK